MAETKESLLSTKTTRIIGLVFLAMYALALVIPEKLWGVHHYTFLPPFAKYGFLILSMLILLAGSLDLVREALKIPGRRSWWITLALAVCAGWLFNSYPIHDDFYGDAPRHTEFLGDSIDSLNVKRTQNVISLEIFDSKIGEKTVLNAVERIAFKTEKTPVEVFQSIAAVSGIIFVLVWVFFILRYIENPGQRFILLVVGLTAPFIQNFFGHVEIYAPFFALVTGYLALLFLYLKTHRKELIWALFIVLFLCLKSHFISFLLVPSLILALVYVRGDEKWKKMFTWKTALKYVIIPVFVFGCGAYFLVFKDHNDPRFLNGMVEESERMFLPLVSPDAPLDNYNLFSPAHLLDYFNNTIHYAGAGLFVLVVFLFNRKRINWNTPEILISGLSLLFFMSLLFMVNPLLSMPMDWDLFSLAAPPLLFFLVAILRNVKEDLSILSAPVLAIGLMTIPIIATNSLPEASSKRLETVGKYTFKNYWIRSAGTIHHGVNMVEGSYVDRMKAVVEELATHAHPTKDVEYANLLWRIGKYYRVTDQLDLALEYYLQAKEYTLESSSFDYVVNLMDLYYQMGRFNEAFAESEILVKNGYPNPKRALAIAVDCGLKAEEYEAVTHYCKEYLKLAPDNPYMLDILAKMDVKDQAVVEAKGMELIKNLESAFKANEYQVAYGYAEELLKIRFPNYRKALRIAIHCALEAEMYEEAQKQSEVFLKTYPDDRLIGEVMRRLETGENPDKIRELFMSGR